MLVLLIALGFHLSYIAAEDSSQADPGLPLLEAFLDLDQALHDDRTVEQARAAAAYLSHRIEACSTDSGAGDIECVLDAVLEKVTAVPVSESGVETSTVTSVLVNRRGSCAALVGAVLALTEQPVPLFDAVVLREHVLLSPVASEREYFETIDAGRRLSTSDLSRYRPFPPNGPVRVPAEEYLAYYADNIAARLADAGRVDLARVFFGKATTVSPSAARIRFNYGTFLLQQEEFARAETELIRAIRLGWKDASAFVNRGAARWQLGRLKAAKRDFRKALKLDPLNREATANLRRLDGEVGSSSTN